MSIMGKLKRRKYFRYELVVNDGGGWKKFGEYKEYLTYNDIENPDAGSLLKLYGVFNDKSSKDGISRESLWEHEVPMPGGGRKADGEKKEKPLEDRLMEKIVEHADFSHLQPSKLSMPFGKTGGSLELQALPGGGSNPYGEIPPISFEGALPAWLHPAAGALIVNLMEKGGKFLRENISGAISDATGIKAKDKGSRKTTEEPPDAVNELDKLLDGVEDEETKKNNEDIKENEKVK